MSGVEIPIARTHIRECSACETPLPLCEAANPEDVRIWVCGRCGTQYRAMLAADYALADLRNVRPAPVLFDRQSIQRLDPEMFEFARIFEASDNHRVEKRSSTRHAVIATLTAQEFDGRLQPVGSPFETICRNLSTGGICLLNRHAIPSDFLVIELSTATGVLIQTLAHVLRRRPIGPYHDIGIEFVTKLAT